MKVIQLTFTGKENTKVFVNMSNVAHYSRYKDFTQIIFNFSLDGTNGGYNYTISVIETPEEIAQLLN